MSKAGVVVGGMAVEIHRAGTPITDANGPFCNGLPEQSGGKTKGVAVATEFKVVRRRCQPAIEFHVRIVKCRPDGERQAWADFPRDNRVQGDILQV